MRSFKKSIIYTLFAANLLIILGIWWNGSGYLFKDLNGIILAFGRLTGLFAVFFALMQFMLIGRAIWIERIFGLDKLAHVHRLNGYLTILFILLHPILTTISYAKMAKVSIYKQWLDFILKYDDVLPAFFAVLIFVAIVFLSIYIVRRHLKYETWYYIHLLTYLAVLMAFGHQLELGGDFITKFATFYWYALYTFVFGNIAIFRFGRPIYNLLKYKFEVERVVAETPDTSSIYITGQNLDKFKIEPGQFIIFRFLAKKFWKEAHPFSLSAVPSNNKLRVTIKCCGDFTKQILNIPKNTKVLLDGPYGLFSAPNPKPQTKFLFIAGGVGITPIRAIIEKLAPTNNLVLLYSNKSTADTIFKIELENLKIKYNFQLNFIMTSEPEFNGEKGRLDQEKIQRLAPDFKEREIYICGPLPMLDSVKALLTKMGVSSGQIHFEKFGF